VGDPKNRQELARLRQEVAAAREEITAAKAASDRAERKVERRGRGIETAFLEFHLEPSVKRSRPPSSKEQKHETYATASQLGRIQYRFHVGFVISFVRLLYISLVLSLVYARRGCCH